MKANAAGMLPAFEAEEQGLLAIAQTGTIGSAEVLGIGTDPDGFSFLLLEPIHSGHRIREYWETLGGELWAMHAAPVPEDFPHSFDFPADNFIGAGKQINAPHSSWVDFYRECRLMP